MTSGEEDFTKRSKSKVDFWFIKGSTLKDPTEALCLPVSIEHIVRISHEQILGTALKTPTEAESVPVSIENAAIAYDVANDRFKVDIEAISVGTLQVDVTDQWNRQLGLVDISRVLGAALSHANPVISRLTDGSAFIDPRDTSDRAARLLGVVYGSLDKLQQRATSKDLYVQIRHEGSEKDPTAIRALTSSDIITVEQATAASLKATVTQDAKDRTITDVSYVGTLKQISETWASAGNKTIWDPAADKKVRVKLISLELSADVDLGFRFAAAGTIYYLRTTKGVIVTNYIGANVEGAADELFILHASAACTAKGYVIGEEV